MQVLRKTLPPLSAFPWIGEGQRHNSTSNQYPEELIAIRSAQLFFIVQWIGHHLQCNLLL